MKKILITTIIALLSSLTNIQAQIGYQVALINNATGEPRALETVAVDVEITNSAGDVIATSRQSATTNELGLLSLTVGDSETFADVDWTKLPFFISATVDGTLIGKTQILSVPVAEYAKHTGELTVDKLCSKTWKYKAPSEAYPGHENSFSISFSRNGSGTFVYNEWQSRYGSDTGWYYELETTNRSFKWHKNGNDIYCVKDSYVLTLSYIPSLKKMLPDGIDFTSRLCD